MRARGQATLELALGTLVLVTVLLYGIAFAEWGVAVQKVKGAVAFAVSTAAGQRTHLFSNGNVASGNTYAPFAPARAGNLAQQRHRDFDPLTASGGGQWTQAMARARGMSSQCRATNDLTFRLQRAGASHRGAPGDPQIDAVFRYLDNRFERRGAVSCSVEAELSIVNVPDRFAEGATGFFQAPHAARGALPLCGVGSPLRGACRGELEVLTGDWAFEWPLNGALAEINDDVPNENPAQLNRPFKRMVEEVWERNGRDQGNANERMMRQLTGITGRGQTSGPFGDPYIDTDDFHMIYRGDGMGRRRVNVQPRELRDDPNLWYQTSGANLDSTYVNWDRRSGELNGVPPCYLGLAGCE
jgi:hypothetical protein